MNKKFKDIFLVAGFLLSTYLLFKINIIVVKSGAINTWLDVLTLIGSLSLAMVLLDKLFGDGVTIIINFIKDISGGND